VQIVPQTSVSFPTETSVCEAYCAGQRRFHLKVWTDYVQNEQPVFMCLQVSSSCSECAVSCIIFHCISETFAISKTFKRNKEVLIRPLSCGLCFHFYVESSLTLIAA
jgi:hypothetical protein